MKLVVTTFKCTEQVREAIREAAYLEGHSNNSKFILDAVNERLKKMKQRCKNKVRAK